MLYTPEGAFEVIDENDYESKMHEFETQLKDYIKSGYLKSFDGANLYYEYVLVQNPKASVVIVHGYTEFLQKYYELCKYLLAMGYNVFMYDHRGHGLSHRDVEDCQVIHVDSFDDYSKDLQVFMNDVVLPNSQNIPVNIFAHSMGCAVTCFYLSQTADSINKTVLSAPMIYPVCINLPKTVLKLLIKNDAKKRGWKARLVRSRDFNPDAKYENSSDGSYARFKYNLDKRLKEPRYQNSCSTNRWNYEALSVKSRLLKKSVVKNINSEVFIIAAGKDTTVKLAPQRKLAKMLNCEYKCVENSKHSLYTQKKDELAQLMNDVLSFFEK